MQLNLLCKSLETSVPYQFYLQNILRINDSHFVLILTLRTDNSGIVLREVRILTLSANLGILTLRRAIPELSRFSLCAEHIYASLVKIHPLVQKITHVNHILEISKCPLELEKRSRSPK